MKKKLVKSKKKKVIKKKVKKATKKKVVKKSKAKKIVQKEKVVRKKAVIKKGIKTRKVPIKKKVITRKKRRKKRIQMDDIYKIVNKVQTNKKKKSFTAELNDQATIENIIIDAGLTYDKICQKTQTTFIVHPNMEDDTQIDIDSEMEIEYLNDEIIEDGEAFMTSGCEGKDGKVACNRPFGNERPSKPMRNFPFLPEKEDVELIKEQLEDHSKNVGN